MLSHSKELEKRKRKSEDQPDAKRQKQEADSADSTDSTVSNEEDSKKEPSLATLKMIVENVRSAGLQNLRVDWSTQPWNVAERREHLTGVFFDEYVGLTDIPGRMLNLFSDPEGRKRPALGMVNAVSGAGKSAALQYCEEYFNKTCANDDSSMPVALAVTFNRFTSDSNTLNASQGLTMRIAERFLMKQGEFDEFREMWKGHCVEVCLMDLIQDIYTCLEFCGTRRRILILVDEPGRAGSPRRKKETGTDIGIAQDVVNATLIIRIENPPAYAWATRFAFSSLTPVFDGDKKLSNETKSRGPVDWIFLPYVKSDKNTKELVARKLKYLIERMPERDFARAIDFLLAMSGGHWATANAMVTELEALDSIGFFRQSDGKKHVWLATIYFQNVRDVIVQVRVRSAELSSVTKSAVFEDLLALAILGKELPPFQELFDFRKGNDILRTLNDFAYDRIISNRIWSNDGSSYAGIVPRLSLLLIRRWCLEQREGYDFGDAIRRVLQHAGNNPTSTPRQPAVAAAIAFEGVATAFLHAKFIAWKRAVARIKSVDERERQVFVVKRELPLTLNDECNYDRDQPFFPGHDPVYGEVPGKMMVPTSKPRLLHIKGTGGFRGKKEEPKKYDKETEHQFEERKTEWLKETMKQLGFVKRSNIRDVWNGDVICPGSKNQAHSDAITVVRFSLENDAAVPGLVFNQFKFSGGDAPTAVDSTHIIAGLDNLLKERGFLFDVAAERKLGNQIAKLDVKEEHVVYCWSVLRKTAGLKTLREKVEEHASRKQFKGSVVVAVSDKVSDQAYNQYGDTFKDLALISESRPPSAFEDEE